MNLTVSKTFELKAVPHKKFSWKIPTKGRKETHIYIGDITFFHKDGFEITPEQRKEYLRTIKTDIVTDGEYFYTFTENKLVRVEHPEFVLPKV